VVPLTTYRGVEWSPAFSPDGESVAFAWDKEIRRDFDIYVKRIGVDPPVRLTSEPVTEAWPAWSPDGRWIAYLRDALTSVEVLVIPATGGEARRITSIKDLGRRLPGPYIAWTEDSRSLIVPDKESPAEPFALSLVDAGTGERRRLTTPPKGSFGDGAPVFSPDFQTLAFVRSPEPEVSLLCTLAAGRKFAASQEPRVVAKEGGRIAALVWSPDGRELIFKRSDSSGAWRVSPGSLQGPRQMDVIGVAGFQWAASARTRRLAFSQLQYDIDIWRLGFDGGPPQRLIASSVQDSAPQVSPDGRRIAFISQRGGSREVWLAGAEGTDEHQLTALNGPDAANPRWSPDGRRIVFSARVAGNSEIFVLDVDEAGTAGRPLRLTHDSANDVFPSFSSDGRWVYFSSDRTGRFTIWKTPAGQDAPVQVTQEAGTAPLESPDGRFLYFAKDYGTTSLWRMPSGGGAPRQVIDQLIDRTAFAMTGEGVLAVRWAGHRRAVNIELLRFAGEAPERLATLEKWLDHSGISAAPGLSYVLFGAEERTGGDLMMLENFH
jgi:Tol biopolymer transport system component